MGLKFSGKALSFRDVTGIAKLTSNRGPQHPAIKQLVVHRQCGVHLRRCLVQLVDCEQMPSVEDVDIGQLSFARVAAGGCPPAAPTDPDVQNSRIRLFGTRIRYAVE